MNHEAGLRDEILGSCFMPYNTRFSSGEWANNKIDIEKLRRQDALKSVIVKRLGAIALECEAQFVMGVPDGAGWLAEQVASKYDICPVRLQKEPDGTFAYSSDIDARIQWSSCRGLLIEDVITTGGSINKVLQDRLIGQGIKSVAAVWDRRNPELASTVPLPVRSLVTEYIPAQLPIDSPYWKYADAYNYPQPRIKES